MLINFRNQILAFALFALFCRPVYGQDTDTQSAAPIRTMTLAEALAYAKAHQPAILAARMRVLAVQADVQVARAQWLPLATLGVQLIEGTTNNTTTSYVSIPGLDIPRIGGTAVTATGSFTPHASTLAGIGLQQEVFDFGRIAAQSAALDALVNVQSLGAKAERLAIAFSVEEAFFAVQAARNIVLASQQAFARAQTHRDMAKAKVAAGLQPTIDLTRSDAEVAQFDVARIRAQGGLDAAQSAFAAAVGVPDLQLDASGEAPPESELPSITSVIARTIEVNPELLQAVARLDAQQALTRSIAALWLPNLALTASFSEREGGADPSSGSPGAHAGWVPDVPNWDVGLVLRWPLYDAVVLARRDSSHAQEAVARADVDAIRQRQISAVQQAYVAVTVAQSALPALAKAVAAAQSNYEQADARFKGGLGTIVELTDAEAVRIDAEIQLALGRFTLARARAALARLVAEEP